MGWGRLQGTSIVLAGLTLAAAADAQPVTARSQQPRIIEAVYSPSDTLSQSVAKVAAQSTYVKPANISQQDLINLMVLLSVSHKHPS
jgi:hypothetical protein